MPMSSKTLYVVLLALLSLPGHSFASAIASNSSGAPDGWQSVSIDAESGRHLTSLELNAIYQQLPSNQLRDDQDETGLIALPHPDGHFVWFEVKPASAMAPALASRYPLIRSYQAIAVGDPTQTARIDLSPAGLRAVVRAATQQWFVEPQTNSQHASYSTKTVSASDIGEYCQADHVAAPHPWHDQSEPKRSAIGPAVNREILVYRFALAATAEFSFGRPLASVLSELVSIVNQLNDVLEIEAGIRLELVDDSENIIYLDPGTDPYLGTTPNQLSVENQMNLDMEITNGGYDLGFVLSRGLSNTGIASIGVPCRSGSKGRGAVIFGGNAPLSAFQINVILHMLGHQFSARHTFNSDAGSLCTSARDGDHAFEPGGGSTLMAFGGACTGSFQSRVDAYFHQHSLASIVEYSRNGLGGTCPSGVDIGNTLPVADAGLDYTIPAQTPFTLLGRGDDLEGDSLTYNWEQMDLGDASPPEIDDGFRPIFRSFPPDDNPSRMFPQLADVLSNTSTPGESLPTTTRTLTFSFNVRDGNGGTSSDTAVLSVDGNSGPFAVTAPNTPTTWQGLDTPVITWDVAGTDASPVNCQSVNIRLSTDGGVTFNVLLASDTANDGMEAITVPNNDVAAARIGVECADNIFFDINDADITIERILLETLFSDGFET